MPNAQVPASRTISILSQVQSIDAFGYAGAGTSAAWPTANKAIFIPFVVDEPFTVKQLAILNGATASGNVDVGIYDKHGTKLVSSGATAQSGTSVLQVFDVTDTVIAAGQYYFAISMNGTSGTLFRNNSVSRYAQAFGLAVMASAHPLPATATLASYDVTFIPTACSVLGVTTI